MEEESDYDLACSRNNQ